MSKYTAAQMRLIDKHRDYNVEHLDWWKDSYESFIHRCSAFGIEISTDRRTVNRKGPDGKYTATSYSEPELYFSLHHQGSCVTFAAESFTIPQFIEQCRLTMLLPDDHEDAWMRTSDDGVVRVLRGFFEKVEQWYGVHLLSAEMRAVLDDHSIVPQLRRERIIVEIHSDPYSDGDATEAQRKLAEELMDLEETFTEFLRDVASAFYDELDDEYDYLVSDEAVYDALDANGLLEEDEECEAT